MKITNKLMVWIVLFLIAGASAYSFGIAPSRKNVDFTSDLQREFSFKVMNSEHKELNVIVYPRGELAEYVNIPKNTMHMSAHEDSAEVVYYVNVPYSMRKPGENIIKIVVEEAPSNYDQQMVVVGKVAIVHELVLNSPYYGAYLDATVTASNIKIFEKPQLTFALFNKGSEDIDGIYAVVEIYDKKFNLVYTEKFDFEMLREGKSSKEIKTLSNELNPGEYTAVAKIYYNNEVIKKEAAFRVGGPYISILSIGSNKFRLGAINEMGISIQSQWSEEIKDVFAEVVVTDENKNVKSVFKTLSIDVSPFAATTIFGYWNTQSLSQGKYGLKVILNYLGIKTEKDFDAILSLEGMKASAADMSGYVVAKGSKKFDGSVVLLTILVIMLIIINIMMLMYLKKRMSPPAAPPASPPSFVFLI